MVKPARHITDMNMSCAAPAKPFASKSSHSHGSMATHGGHSTVVDSGVTRMQTVCVDRHHG